MSGDDVIFTEDDNVTCIFGDDKVDGVYVNEEQVLCVSPELSQTGVVLFQLEVEHGGTIPFRGEANYNSCKFLILNYFAIIKNHLFLQCHFREPLKALLKVKSLSLRVDQGSESIGLLRVFFPLQIIAATLWILLYVY